jgi:ABC-type glycerol-3-phosphate transport system substrate-binding protein
MVNTICNGQDPVYDHQLSYSRTEVATKLFANTSEMYINDGKIDVNTESFKAILDYCKELPSKGYFEGKDLDAEFEDIMYAKESMAVQPTIVYGFYEYEAVAAKYPDVAICGYPSVDGRTATIGSDMSVSVSSHSENLDACKEFLKVLLSDDIQSTIESNIPVNKNCAKALAVKEIELNNYYVEKNSDQQFAKTGDLMDPSVADAYIAELSKATTSSFVYHNISLIIYEEIPAYFEGQKSFEEVCQIINDRAQKVLDERK